MRSIRKSKVWCLLCVGLLAACPGAPEGPRYVGARHPKPTYGGTLLLSEETKVRTLDPHRAFDEISSVLTNMLFDALYAYDRNMQLVPAVAATLPELSPDGLVFRIPIRQGVRFHHGREVTATDVVWSLERVLSPALHSGAAPLFSAIAGMEEFTSGKTKHLTGIKAEGRYRVDIRLSRADQSFAQKLAMGFTAVVPREMVERPGKDFAAAPVGTGPFMLSEWERGVRVVLKRHSRYYRPHLPYLDRVVFEEDIGRETAFLRFRNGEVDVLTRTSPPDKVLLEGPKWRGSVATVSRADIFGIVMNAEMAPFDNVHVRRAVSFAIDRTRWAKSRNFAMLPTGQMLPPAIAGYDAKLPNVQHFDLARAKEEMRLAGFPDGIPEPVTMWGSDGATGRHYAELLQADLSKIGIRVEFKSVSFPVFLEETGKPRRAQLAFSGWVMDYPDPSNFLGLVSSALKAPVDSSNRSFYSDPRLDKLLDDALVERDLQKRTRMYREANDFIAREAPWAFTFNSAMLQAWQPYVKGYSPHPAYWMPVNEVWLDLPRRRIAGLFGRAASALAYAGLLPEGIAP